MKQDHFCINSNLTFCDAHFKHRIKFSCYMTKNVARSRSLLICYLLDTWLDYIIYLMFTFLQVPAAFTSPLTSSTWKWVSSFVVFCLNIPAIFIIKVLWFRKKNSFGFIFLGTSHGISKASWKTFLLWLSHICKWHPLTSLSYSFAKIG